MTETHLSSPVEALDGSLIRLESALNSATAAVESIRETLPRIEALTEIVRAMEMAMATAQQRFSAPDRPTPEAAPTPVQIYGERPAVTTPDISEAPSHPESSHSLQLRVVCKAGPLDLKAVDAAVGEQSGVVDVALLEYDGRSAAFQVWTGDQSPVRIGEALLDGLQRRLGGDESADVQIEILDAA